MRRLPDGVTCSEPNPLRNRPVLTLGFGKLALGAERFVTLSVEGAVKCQLSDRWNVETRVHWEGQ